MVMVFSSTGKFMFSCEEGEIEATSPADTKFFKLEV